MKPPTLKSRVVGLLLCLCICLCLWVIASTLSAALVERSGASVAESLNSGFPS